ncbi:MAG: hypothetical protein ACLU8W_12605 [Clostridia bacterium]
MMNTISAVEIKKAMEEVSNTRSWRKIGKAIKLYGLCTTQEMLNPYEPIVR